jgi:acetoacetyl-CoA synthetase
MTVKLWEPPAQRIAQANITAFARRMEERHGVGLPDYASLWRWSIESPETFWREVWEDGGVIGKRGERTLVDGDRMPGARWFPDARLNFAQNLLERRPADDAGDALVFWGEDKVRRRMSHRELHANVSRVASALGVHGLRVGDRVAAFMPNIPETIVAMLGAAARGAVFSSCSPDFGVEGVLDRFGQIAPRVLFTVDGYWYNGKPISILDKVAEIVERLPTVERVVVVPYLDADIGRANEFPVLRGGTTWEAFLAPFAPGTIDYAQLPFDHPLYIVYSSGTTGVPKCILHSAGGVLL